MSLKDKIKIKIFDFIFNLILGSITFAFYFWMLIDVIENKL